MENANISKSSTIDKNSTIIGKTVIGKNCIILGSVLENAIVGDNVKIINSVVTNSEIKNNVTVGPFANLRDGALVEDDVRIGNFVEIKNSHIGKRTKVAHLAYIGDADVGEDVNVGCGVIFANYDGKNKHKTIVGNRVFIGSNSNLIAPLFVEDDVFVAAGTTVTNNLSKGEFCIGRVRNQTLKNAENLYAQKFMEKLKFFGTDGIRGVYGEKLTDELAEKVGFAITQLSQNPIVLIGKDTRHSGDRLFEAITNGIYAGGGQVVDVGVVPTACVCYLTKLLKCDYGVMITASHNPSEYNGIKIFGNNGYKLNENQEKQIEEYIEKNIDITKTHQKPIPAQKRAYFELLESAVPRLDGMKIFLDCANGSASIIAPKVFKNLGAEVESVNINGEINKNAGVLDKKIFIEEFKKSQCEIGFCFDGDADRVMCITKNGVLDGDRIMYIIAKTNHEKYAVGTIMTNLALEGHLAKIGTKLVRVEVGDKNIARSMKSKKYKLGAEQSGHVILGDFLQSGDGILTALVLSNIYGENAQIFDEALNLEMLYTENTSVVTENIKILKSDDFLNYKVAQEKYLTNGRIIVRASGTEPKIRITVEDEIQENAKKIAENIKKYLENNLNN